jgi:hypothetical protein
VRSDPRSPTHLLSNASDRSEVGRIGNPSHLSQEIQAAFRKPAHRTLLTDPNALDYQKEALTTPMAGVLTVRSDIPARYH